MYSFVSTLLWHQVPIVETSTRSIIIVRRVIIAEASRGFCSLLCKQEQSGNISGLGLKLNGPQVITSLCG